MNFKLLQFSPHESTRAVRIRVIPERWSRGYDYSRGVGFLPAWMDDDFCQTGDAGQHQINWGAVSGLALSLAVSGGFWAGLGLLIARILR